MGTGSVHREDIRPYSNTHLLLGHDNVSGLVGAGAGAGGGGTLNRYLVKVGFRGRFSLET